MELRIAICGASGTGKSSIIAKINDDYNLPINPVGSRSVSKEMGYNSPYDVDKDGKRKEFQHRLMKSKIEWENNNSHFITDRTTIDVLSYTMIHDIYAVDRDFLNNAIRGYDRYTHVFFCPVSEFCNVGNDPARVHSGVYHEVYEAAMLGVLGSFIKEPSLLPVKLFGSILESRVSQVKDFIKNHASDF